MKRYIMPLKSPARRFRGSFKWFLSALIWVIMNLQVYLRGGQNLRNACSVVLFVFGTVVDIITTLQGVVLAFERVSIKEVDLN